MTTIDFMPVSLTVKAVRHALAAALLLASSTLAAQQTKREPKWQCGPSAIRFVDDTAGVERRQIDNFEPHASEGSLAVVFGAVTRPQLVVARYFGAGGRVEDRYYLVDTATFARVRIDTRYVDPSPLDRPIKIASIGRDTSLVCGGRVIHGASDRATEDLVQLRTILAAARASRR